MSVYGKRRVTLLCLFLVVLAVYRGWRILGKGSQMTPARGRMRMRTYGSKTYIVIDAPDTCAFAILPLSELDLFTDALLKARGECEAHETEKLHASGQGDLLGFLNKE